MEKPLRKPLLADFAPQALNIDDDGEEGDGDLPMSEDSTRIGI
jgi:hypothetical protein